MNKKLKSDGQLWEAAVAIIIGLLFVVWPNNVIKWAVLFIGILSLVAGIIQLIVYFANRKKANTTASLLIIGALTLIWGALLLLRPDVWVNLFMIVMSIPMVLMAIWQLSLLIRKRRAGYTVPWGYYVFPVLFLLAGVTVMFNPFATAMWLVFFVGLWIIAYGVVEMVNYFAIRD